MGSAGSKETDGGVHATEVLVDRILPSDESKVTTAETLSSTSLCHDSPPAVSSGHAKEAWSNSFEAANREIVSDISAWEDPILGFSQEDVPAESQRITTARDDEEGSRSFEPPPQECIDNCRTAHDGLELEVL
jgi:hypothetical protein